MFYNILEKFLPERLHPKKTIYFSDAVASQYKNRKNFINLCLHEDDFGILAEWHFYATYRGKGACDGVGGSVKRLAARASLQKPYNDKVITPHFIGRSQLCHLFTLTIATWRSTKEYKILLSNARTIPGTRTLHSFLPISRRRVRVCNFSSSTTFKEERVTLKTSDL